MARLNYDDTYDMLHDAVEAGDVEITLVVGAPRTVTTALTGALAQSDAVGVEHVFHENFTDIVYSKMQKFLQTPHPNRPQHIVIKEMSPCDSIGELMSLSKHVIFTGREPLQHAMAKHPKKTDKARTMQNVSLSDLHKAEPEEYDLPTETKQFGELRGRFNDSALHHTAEWLQVALEKYEKDGLEVSVVDGDVFRMMPETVLQQLSAKSGIPYDDRMHANWQGVHRTSRDNWCKTYRKSRAIMRPKQVTPFVEGTYDTLNYTDPHDSHMMLMASGHTIWPEANDYDGSSLEQVLTTMGEQCEIDDHTMMRFDDMEPPTAYMYVASFPAENDAERQTKTHYLNGLRDRHPEHSPAYDMTDNWLTEQKTPRPVADTREAKMDVMRSLRRAIS